jgi:hypothetical protein
MAEEEDINALIETDARVYLRQTESFKFTDGLADNSGPYVLGTDYTLGDVVGILDEVFGTAIPVKVVEVVITVEPGSATKYIPTFEVYTEKDPDEQ